MAPRLNIPPLTRGLILGLLIFTLLNAAARYRSWSVDLSRSYSGELIHSRVYYAPYLTIVPGQSIIYPWVILTASLAEQNVLGLLITGASLFYGGRYLERAWSSREYTKFIVLIALIPNVVTWLCYILLFAVTGHEGLVTTAISGGIAVQAAFLVSFKQLVPEHTVYLFRSLISMRVKHFPAIFLVANTISGILLGTDTAMLLAWCGFFVSWTYLRFYRISPSLFTTTTGIEAGSGQSTAASDAIRGDASDTFAFAAFFPDAVQPPIAALSNIVYTTLVSVRILPAFSAADVEAGNEQASVREGGMELPGLMHSTRGSGARNEAERRRALALRALDQRLHQHAQQGRRDRIPEPTVVTPKLSEVAAKLGQSDEPQGGGVGQQASAGHEQEEGEDGVEDP